MELCLFETKEEKSAKEILLLLFFFFFLSNLNKRNISWVELDGSIITLDI